MTTTTSQPRTMKPLKPLSDAQRMALEEGRLPRPAVSADAQYIAGTIVKHLWIIFVALPVVGLILFLLVK